MTCPARSQLPSETPSCVAQPRHRTRYTRGSESLDAVFARVLWLDLQTINWMHKIKYAVIGLGWFGEKHCEALAGLSSVDLYALCTRTESRLRYLADRFDVRHVYTDYNELLANSDVEAVSITTMWDQHVQPAVAAIRARKHVFLEKPMAATLAECRAIVETVRASDQSLMVGHICRFNPRYAAAKMEIEAGKIGKIVSMYARRNIPASVGEQVLNKIGPILGGRRT